MNLRVVGANLVVSIKSFYREKTAMFFTMAFPIILILVFGTIFQDQENVSFNLYVQDLDHTDSSAQLVQTLERNGKFKITKTPPLPYRQLGIPWLAFHHVFELVRQKKKYRSLELGWTLEDNEAVNALAIAYSESFGNSASRR
jgi:hypothetical protein